MRKFIMFPLTRLVVALSFIAAGGFAISLVCGSFLHQLQNSNPPLAMALTYIIATPVIILAYVYYVRLIETRRVTEFSHNNAWRECGAGLLTGMGLMVVCVLIISIFGGFRLQGMDSVTGMLLALGLSIGTGFIEEIVFRGILFRIIEEALGSWVAIVLSSLFFGFSHLTNDNASLFAAIAISIEAGVLLAAAYMLTRRLWLVIGMHIAWNFVLGGIFGLAVSGEKIPGLLKTELVGTKLLTGGEFGVESSLVAILVCGSLALFMLILAHQRGRFVLPFWMRPEPLPGPESVSEPVIDME